MATLNHSKVLEYVDKYWNRRNNQFFDYGESNCTNFVSQCWNYAGIPQTNNWKPYDVLTGRFGRTPSAKVGDIIQFYNEARGGWYHSDIVSKFDTTYGLCYAAHSTNHRQKPLSDVYLKPDPKYGGKLSFFRFICPINITNLLN